jgi:hypothetical protein
MLLPKMFTINALSMWYHFELVDVEGGSNYA